VNSQKRFTFDAALAQHSCVVVDDEDKFDDHVECDKSGHDGHAPVEQTELPDTEEHGRR